MGGSAGINHQGRLPPKSIALVLEGIVTNGVEFAMTDHISPDLFVYLNCSVLSAVIRQKCGGDTGLSSASLSSLPFPPPHSLLPADSRAPRLPRLSPLTCLHHGVIITCQYLMGCLFTFHLSAPTGWHTPKRQEQRLTYSGLPPST